MSQGTLFIIIAPSGAGKTSLVRELVSNSDRLKVSISHTTRPKRGNEQDGVNYHFIDVERFKQMVADEQFLEHAEVFGKHYGTSKTWVTEQLEQGIDIILEIDWQGAKQIQSQYQEAVGIFILPPSRDALEERLHKRGQDTAEVIAIRLAEARTEMSHALEFNYVVVNDDFDKALDDLKGILRTHRLRSPRQGVDQASLLESLLADG